MRYQPYYVTGSDDFASIAKTAHSYDRDYGSRAAGHQLAMHAMALECTPAQFFPNMAREHPDFDQATLPDIPAGWTDSTWRNDACPCFETGVKRPGPSGAPLCVFIDYTDADEREFFDCPERYTVSWACEGEPLYHGDDWSAVLRGVRHLEDMAKPATPFYASCWPCDMGM